MSTLAENDATFHRFPDLPAELRLMVWRWCLPHRVVELDDVGYDENTPYECGLTLTTFLNRARGCIRIPQRWAIRSGEEDM